MSELDLTEAIEAGVDAALAEYHVRLAAVTTTTGPVNTTAYAKAAVRAAAPIIERAVREQLALQLESADSPLCDCGDHDSDPVSPKTGLAMDHHCDCPAVAAAGVWLGDRTATEHFAACDHPWEAK